MELACRLNAWAIVPEDWRIFKASSARLVLLLVLVLVLRNSDKIDYEDEKEDEDEPPISSFFQVSEPLLRTISTLISLFPPFAPVGFSAYL
jgi:hypothetical protein